MSIEEKEEVRLEYGKTYFIENNQDKQERHSSNLRNVVSLFNE